MKELTRNELAICKRTAKSTKLLRDKKAKITAKIEELEKDLAVIEESIEIFEAPIKHLTGGFTSEEVLNGTMEVVQAMENKSEGEVSEEVAEVHEVPTEEAVEIDPNVESPLDVFGESNECGTDYNEVPFVNEENN